MVWKLAASCWRRSQGNSLNTYSAMPVSGRTDEPAPASPEHRVNRLPRIVDARNSPPCDACNNPGSFGQCDARHSSNAAVSTAAAELTVPRPGRRGSWSRPLPRGDAAEQTHAEGPGPGGSATPARPAAVPDPPQQPAQGHERRPAIDTARNHCVR